VAPASAPDPAGLRWLGHSSVLLEGPPAVYVDPWRLEGRKGLPRAGLILVTHAHFDHASPEDVALVAGEETLLAGPAAALARLPGARRRVLEAGDSFVEAGVRVTALPAWDVEGGFHPPDEGLGFLIEGAGPRLLHAGDTALAPPRCDPPPDVIALPVCGGTVLDAGAAAAAAAASGAAAALPIHWGDLQGGWSDAVAFREALARLAPGMRTILRGPPGEPR
jgi:L-ascorbate metabolism protein UlaG (beta-lactamase superfamily)